MLTLLFIGILSLTFDIQPVEAPYPIIYIKADGSIDPSTANITSPDNVTYTFTADINASIVVEKNNTVVDGAGYTVQGPGSGTGIDLSYRNNVTLKNVEVTNFTYGIYLFYSGNNTVTGNNASNNDDDGISLYSSSNNNIIGNTVSSNGDEGIYLESSSNNTVTGNNASNNGNGIYLFYSGNNTVTGNNASNNGNGICLDSSSNNTVTGNNASSNGFVGIFLGSSGNNTVTGNTASNNGDDGIYLDSSSNNTLAGNTASNNDLNGICLDSSSNNVLFQNNLIGNTVQAGVTTGYVNTWDDGYPSGGNYWSDYNGTDTCSGQYQNETGSDGIGDTSYTIDVSNQDNYPLMGMFSDFVVTLEYHVQTICNSSVSDFQFNGTAICFNVTGENDTTGFCRICIPRALMNETYKVFVNGTEVPCNLLPCSNSTHCYLYFTYNHSTQEVVIVPEFPTWTSMLLILIVLSVAIAIYKRRILKTSIN